MFAKGDRIHYHSGRVQTVRKNGYVPALRTRRSSAGGTQLAIRGFMRAALVEPDGTELPSDWYENQITNYGWRALVNNFGGLDFSASNVSVTASSNLALARYLCVGYESRTAATSDIAALSIITSEYGTANNSTVNAANALRAAIAASQSNVGSYTLSQSWAFASSHLTNNATLNAVGMHYHSAVGNGSLLSLATFASSAKSSNQALNVTYNFQFASV